MAYTKYIGKYDKITIDGTDVSNSFREFGFSSEHAQVDVSGFSASGADEFLPGNTTQQFTGTAFYTEELGAIIGPIHVGRELVEIVWQPNGLSDATREVYHGNCYILQFGPATTRGDVVTMPFTAVAGDSTGIVISDWT